MMERELPQEPIDAFFFPQTAKDKPNPPKPGQRGPTCIGPEKLKGKGENLTDSVILKKKCLKTPDKPNKSMHSDSKLTSEPKKSLLQVEFDFRGSSSPGVDSNWRVYNTRLKNSEKLEMNLRVTQSGDRLAHKEMISEKMETSKTKKTLNSELFSARTDSGHDSTKNLGSLSRLSGKNTGLLSTAAKDDLSVSNLDLLDFACLTPPQKHSIKIISQLWTCAADTASLFEGPYDMKFFNKPCQYIGMIDEKKTPVGFGKLFFPENKLYIESFFQHGKMSEFVLMVTSQGHIFVSLTADPERSLIDKSKCYFIPYKRLTELHQKNELTSDTILQKFSYILAHKFSPKGGALEATEKFCFKEYSGNCNLVGEKFVRSGLGVKFETPTGFELGVWN